MSVDIARELERLRDQLHEALTGVQLAPGSEAATIRAAHRRRRFRRGLAGAAGVVVLASGLFAVSRLGTSEPGAVSTHPGTEPVSTAPAPMAVPVPAPATPTTMPVVATTAPAATEAAAAKEPFQVTPEPAQPADPRFVWDVATPPAGGELYGSWVGRVPGVVIASTPEPAAFYTADGVTFEALDLAPPSGPLTLFADGDSIYNVGMRPDAPAGEPNPIVADVSVDRGRTWATVELPVDLSALAGLDGVISGYDASVTATDAGPVILANRWAQIDTAEFDVLRDVTFVQESDGVKVFDDPCTPSAAGGECPSQFFTWADLGLSPEAAEVLTVDQVRAFRVVAGEPVELDVPDGVTSLWATPTGDFFSSAPEGDLPAVYRLGAEATWLLQDLPPAVVWSTTDPAATATHAFAAVHQVDISPNAILAASAGTDWTYTDLASLYEEFERPDLLSQAATPDAFALGVAVRTDLIAERGGVEITHGGVTVRRADDMTDFEIVDAATGEPIAGAASKWGRPDSGFTVVGTGGVELATFTVADAAELQAYDETPGWAIVTTVDGVHLASEPVADLLGVTDADITGVQLDAVDRRLVLRVTLAAEAAAGVPDQRILVGTPIE